jgi:hypothetical protein
LIEPYRFVIHGGIDGYSRLIVFLQASTNNRADTVFRLFQEAIATYNIPSRVRSDKGLENIEVGWFMIQVRGTNRGSILTGSSVHNQRIERLWREVDRVLVSRFRNIFLFLEQSNVFICTDEIHLYCLHLVYLPLINQALTEFAQQWNDHPVSTECNYTPRQMWVQGMLQLRHSNLTAVQSVIGDAEHINPDEYGVDEEGPVPVLESEGSVVVPQIALHMSDNDLETLQETDAAVPSENNGIICYIVALSTIARILEADRANVRD